jgi:hypothetical protein
VLRGENQNDPKSDEVAGHQLGVNIRAEADNCKQIKDYAPRFGIIRVASYALRVASFKKEFYRFKYATRTAYPALRNP